MKSKPSRLLVKLWAFFLIVIASTAMAVAFVDLDYSSLIRDPKAARSNAEFRAFLVGVGTAIRVDYQCNEIDRTILADPDRMIDTLVDHARTAKGTLALEEKTGFGQTRYRSMTGEVLIDIFTRSFPCQAYKEPKQQLYP